jgi:hypothetical protein
MGKSAKVKLEFGILKMGKSPRKNLILSPEPQKSLVASKMG